MRRPKVSVIIPNYNHAPYLRRRITSVLDQTFAEFEVLILDDASTDSSREIIAEFAEDPRARCLFNEQNSGSTFAQWNRAVPETQGEYLWFAESDDSAEPTLLAELVERLERHPQCGLAYCQSWQMDESDNPIRCMVEHTDDLDSARWRSDFVNSGTDEIARYLFIKNTIPNASAVLIRRTAWDAAGGADPTMRLCGDWLFWAKILATSDVAFVAKPLNYFREHASTVRAKRSRTLLLVYERYRIMDFILRHSKVDPILQRAICDHVGNVCEVYLQEDPEARDWIWRVYQMARRVDPQLHRMIINKTLRPWLGSVKNRFLRLLRLRSA